MPMMKCGHAANATNKSGKPICAICHGLTPDAQIVVEPPNLTGRIAKCGCGNEKPSSLDLPFFEYCGPGSWSASICTCGFAESAHESGTHKIACKNYNPRGDIGYDRFYCGCRGWD